MYVLGVEGKKKCEEHTHDMIPEFTLLCIAA